MLTVKKTFLQNLNSKSIYHYYQSRREQAKSALELEAITYTQSLLALYDWSDSNNGKVNK